MSRSEMTWAEVRPSGPRMWELRWKVEEPNTSTVHTKTFFTRRGAERARNRLRRRFAEVKGS